MACHSPPLEKAKKQPYPSSVLYHLNQLRILYEKKRKTTKSDFFSNLFLNSHILQTMFVSIFVNCQAVSLYLHAGFVLGYVASLAIIWVIHKQGNTGRVGGGHELFFAILVPMYKKAKRISPENKKDPFFFSRPALELAAFLHLPL